MNPAADCGDPIEVDARGLRCPLPVIRLAQAARDAAAGTYIVVLASDPAARYDIPAWCRMRDHELRELTEVSEEAAVSGSSGTNGQPAGGAHSGYLRFVVLVRPQPLKAGGPGSGRARSSRAM